MPKLESINNLRLAWNRTLAGQNYSYREHQTIELSAFAWAKEENLLQLRNELTNHAYEPSEATKIFIPKPSGLVRPITILRIRDTVIYQAIGNLIADKVRAQLSANYFKLVFSNILPERSSQYFFRNWKFCLRKLDSEKKQAFNNGNVWMGKLDLASFYDLIDHKLLGRILLKTGVNTDVVDFLIKCLGKWTLYPKGLEHGHGVPQGPLVSSLLAECVLSYLDKHMVGLNNSVYLRYVDDITIMSKSEKDARKQFARIELICRQLGLIPTIKSPIRKYDKMDERMVDEPSSPASFLNDPNTSPKLDKAQSDRMRKIFLSCFQGNKLRKEENIITKLRFSLYRMNKDRRMLNKVFYLLEEFPCIYEAMNYYLRKFGADKDIGSRIIKYLDSEPLYHTVTATTLETLFFSCVTGQLNKLRTHSLHALSLNNNVILRCAGIRVLCLRNIYVNRLQKLLFKKDELFLRERVLSSLNDNLSKTTKETILNTIIRGSNAELALIASYLLTRDEIKLWKSRKNINAWATPILAKFGLAKKQLIGDRIGEIIKKRYGVMLPASFNFRKMLKLSDYKQALLHLNQAEGAFDTQRAFWLVQMDNVNQLILYTIFNKKLHMPIAYPDVFGSIDSTRLKNMFPNLQLYFKDCHKKRSSSFISHAYSKEKNTYTTDLRIIDRNKQRNSLKKAYQELVNNY